MILADTSVWVDHFRSAEPKLVDLLNRSAVLVHPFVLGELACGNLANRGPTLELLGQLPAAALVEDQEALSFIASHKLFGKGIGIVDVHLLASVAITGDTLWTRDKRLRAIAVQMGCCETESRST